MHVIMVPAPGGDPELLWHRFAEVVGLGSGGYDLTPPEGNPSLGAASAELMRRVNLATRDRGLSWDACAELLKKALAKQELSRRRGAEPALALPAEYHQWAMGQGKRIISEVEHSGAHVAGDLEELIPDPAGGRDGVDPSRLSEGDLLEASVDGLAGMVGRAYDLLSEAQTVWRS